MDYLRRFLERKEPAKLSLTDQVVLSYASFKQFVIGYFPGYKQRLTEDYYPEEMVLANWDELSQTPGYKRFKKRYQPKLHGVEKIPDKDGAMIISNHTTISLVDVAPIYFGIYEQKRRALYGIGHDLITGDIVKTIGGMSRKNTAAVLKILQEDKLFIICPEGIEGACRPWHQNNKVLPVGGFKHLSYLKLAYKVGKPIIPVANVGAEEVIIVVKNVKKTVMRTAQTIDSLFDIRRYEFGRGLFRLLNDAKIVPLPFNLLPSRAKVDAYVGDTINPRELLGSNPTEEDFLEVNNMVMKSLQDLIDQHKRKEGLSVRLLNSWRGR